MSDIKTDLVVSNNEVPHWVLISCAAFIMVIQTISMALNVIGFDEVVRAYAKKAEAEILSSSDTSVGIEQLQNRVIVLQKDLISQKVDFILRLEALEKNSHKANK